MEALWLHGLPYRAHLAPAGRSSTVTRTSHPSLFPLRSGKGNCRGQGSQQGPAGDVDEGEETQLGSTVDMGYRLELK